MQPSSTGIERRLGGRVATAHNDSILVECLVSLTIDVRNERKVFSGNSQVIR